MAQDNDDECETCDGQGVVVEDTFVNGRERHEEVPCPDCQDEDSCDELPDDDLRHDDGRREPDPMRSWL